MTYEYLWVDADDHADLSEMGALGWRVVPGTLTPDDMLLMERSKEPAPDLVPPPGSDPAIS